MSPLARSCLRLLVMYAVIATAVGLAVHHRFPVTTAAIWSGVIAGFFVWLTLAYLYAIPTHLLEWLRLRPGVVPRDGKRVALIGPIHNSGVSLHAPFSRSACVAYLYNISNFAGKSPKKDYEGFALVPSYIHSEHGPVKLLAYPDLEVPEEPVRGQEAKRNAAEYLARTSFTDTRQAGFKGMTEEMRRLAMDDDGSIRYDHRIDPVAGDLDKCRITEKLVKPGDIVCATGVYSEERKALVPDPKAIMHAVTLRVGEPAALRRKPLRKAAGSAFGVVFCGALLTGAAILFLINVPMDAADQMNPARRFFWEEVKLERWLERNIRMPLIQSGTMNDPPMHLMQNLCEGCATGRLEANDHVIELRHASGWENEETRVIHLAAKEGEKDGVAITFDRRQKPVSAAIGYPWTITVTVNGTPFPVPADWTIPRDVQHVHDSAEVINGRVTVIDPNGAVRVRSAFRAVIEQR